MEDEIAGLRCDLCEHWREPEDQDWQPRKVGFRECVAVRAKWTVENKAVEGDPWPGGPHLKFRENEDGIEVTDDEAWNAYDKKRVDAIKAERAYVQDMSDAGATLYTGPDFFCAKFTSKEVRNV